MTRSVRGIALTLALAIVVVGEVVPSSGAATATRNWHWYYGTVTHVRDGDTIIVDITEPERAPHTTDGYPGWAIRAYGINAFADRRQLGYECWGPDATHRMEQEVGDRARADLYLQRRYSNAPGDPYEGQRVKLRGNIDSSADAFGRLAMRVFVEVDGQWVDVAGRLLKAGLGLPSPSSELTDAQNRAYRRKAWKARTDHRRIWSGDGCGGGPASDANLRLRVRWEADGDDDANLNGEWVQVINEGADAVSLGGWQLRDLAMQDPYVFPNITLEAGERVTVFGGAGTSSGLTRYWRNQAGSRDGQLFSGSGDGIVLLDPGGDIRAYQEFPCLFECRDALSGKVTVSAMYDPPGGDTPMTEWVDIRNVSDGPVDLYDHYLSNDGDTYLFDVPTVLAPGQSVRVRVGGNPNNDTRFERFWGKTRTILQSSGDRVELLGLDGREVACYGWGGERC